MSSIIYEVLDQDGLSTLFLSERQMSDLEKRICLAHEVNQTLGREALLTLGKMKIISINDPDLCWD